MAYRIDGHMSEPLYEAECSDRLTLLEANDPARFAWPTNTSVALKEIPSMNTWSGRQSI